MSDDTLSLGIVATLSDKASGGIAGITTAITQLGSSASATAAKLREDVAGSVAQLGPAFDKVGASLPGVTGGIGQVSSALRGLMANPIVAITTAVVGATAALGAFSVAQSDAVHHLTLLSQQTGLTVSELGGLKKAGAESGLSVEQIANAAVRLETNMGKGGKAIKQLGIDAKDPVDAMAQVADKFDAATSQSQRAAIGNAAFGRSWKELTPLLQEGGQALKDAAGASHMDQETIDAYNQLHETLRQIHLVWVSTEKTIAAAVAGPIAAMADSFLSAYKTIMGMGDGMDLLKTVASYVAKDIGTVVELLGDAAVIAKGALLMAFDTVANDAFLLVKGISEVGLGISKIVELTGHGKGMEDFFRGGIEWADKMSEKVDQGVVKQLGGIGDHLSGFGNRMRAIWAEDSSTPERKKKFSGSGGEGEEQKDADQSAKIAEQLAAFRTKLAAENAEQVRQLRSKAAMAALKEEKDSRQREIELYDAAFYEEQRKYAGNADALKALQQIYRSEIAAINRKWDEKDEADKEKKEREGLKRFAAIEKQKSEIAQKELEAQSKSYDKTWGKIVGTTATSATRIITTHGGMTARIQAAEDALYEGLINDAAQWLASTAEDMVKKQVLADAMRTAEQSKAAAAAAESAVQAELTGKTLASAYSTAAAMASVATFGAADVSGTAALTAAVTASKGLTALAGGGMNFGGALVGDGGRAEVSTPTVPQRITQTSQSTVHNSYGGANIVINTVASVDRVAAVTVRAATRQARGMVRSSR